MSSQQSVEQDERTEAVLGLSARLATFYFLLAIPADYLYRAMVRHENAWDLMAVYVGGVAVALIYQVRERTLGKSFWVKVAIIAAITAVTAAAASAITRNAAWSTAITAVVTGITAAVVSAAMTRAK